MHINLFASPMHIAAASPPLASPGAAPSGLLGTYAVTLPPSPSPSLPPSALFGTSDFVDLQSSLRTAYYRRIALRVFLLAAAIGMLITTITFSTSAAHISDSHTLSSDCYTACSRATNFRCCDAHFFNTGTATSRTAACDAEYSVPCEKQTGTGLTAHTYQSTCSRTDCQCSPQSLSNPYHALGILFLLAGVVNVLLAFIKLGLTAPNVAKQLPYWWHIFTLVLAHGIPLTALAMSAHVLQQRNTPDTCTIIDVPTRCTQPW